MQNRIALAEYFNALGFKTGAEIGVYYGRFSAILCQTIPGLKLYAIDDWGERYAHSFEPAKANLKPYGVTIIRKDSLEAAPDFEDNSLDFVFIDARHNYKHVSQDIIEWTRKVRNGGVVAGHDYIPTSLPGPKDAVDTYLKYHPNLHLYLTNPKDHPRSWWFIKP